MNLTQSHIKNIIKEELEYLKKGLINEDITSSDERKIRELIRTEVASIFFTLFKRRSTWGA